MLLLVYSEYYGKYKNKMIILKGKGFFYRVNFSKYFPNTLLAKILLRKHDLLKLKYSKDQKLM